MVVYVDFLICLPHENVYSMKSRDFGLFSSTLSPVPGYVVRCDGFNINVSPAKFTWESPNAQCNGIRR